MLKRGIRSLVIIFLLFLLSECKDTKWKELQEKRILYKKHSKQQIGNQEYASIFNAANDSIKNWTNNHLADYAIYAENDWHLDSLICVNANKDRCVMALSYQLRSSENHDGMNQFYGAKINGKWYFFRGGAFHLPREYYVSPDSVRYPLSFRKLDEIAMQNIFRGYLKKNSKNEWEINDSFFTSRLEGVGWGDFNNQPKEDWFLKGKRFTNQKDYYEFIYMDAVKKNWSWKEK